MSTTASKPATQTTEVKDCPIHGLTEHYVDHATGGNRGCKACDRERWKARRDERRKADPMYGRSASERARHAAWRGVRPDRQRALGPADTSPASEEERAFLDKVAEISRKYAPIDAEYEAEPRGFVYAAVNAHYQDWVKIGMAKTPEKRVAAANTFCPYRGWKIIWKTLVDEHAAGEKLVHSELQRHRASSGAEFFKVSRDTAIDALEILLCGNAFTSAREAPANDNTSRGRGDRRSSKFDYDVVAGEYD